MTDEEKDKAVQGKSRRVGAPVTRKKANDYPSNVQEEIEAATILGSPWSETEIPQQYKLGYIAYYGREDPPAWVGIAWRAGWLAAEMDVVVACGLSTGWPWDPSRPLEGQYEEYVANKKPGVCDRQATNQRNAGDTNFCVGDDHSTHCPLGDK